MRRVAPILLLMCLVPRLAPAQSAAQRLYRDRRPAMGTTAEVLVYAPSREVAEALFEVAFEEIERVENLLSDYRPGSELSRINAVTGPVTLDPEMTRVMNRVLGWARQSGGAFDPTVGPLVDVWLSARDSTEDGPPDPSQIDDALGRTGWRSLHLDLTSRTLTKDLNGMRLDPGAFGKGYALDQAAGALRDAGATQALLGFGGSSYLALDPPPGQPGWLIHVDDPTDEGGLATSVSLRNGALSTSGVSPVSGRHHILDPRSGSLADASMQATVLATNAMDADILSTAAYVLGPDGAGSLIGPVPGTQAWIIHPSPSGARVRTIRWPSN